MGLDKLLKKLKTCFKSTGKASIDCEEMDALLEKLQRKRAKIKKKLEKEEKAEKRRSLKLEQKIIDIQLKKGNKFLKEMHK